MKILNIVNEKIRYFTYEYPFISISALIIFIFLLTSLFDGLLVGCLYGANMILIGIVVWSFYSWILACMNEEKEEQKRPFVVMVISIINLILLNYFFN